MAVDIYGNAVSYFSSTQATNVSCLSTTPCTATSPAESAGVVNVTVTTPGGTSATSSADDFTYDNAPTVTSISPTAGYTSGGTAVTITGTGFTSSTAVMFGSVTATAVTINSATSISTTSPAGSAGTVNVTVTAPSGTSATSSADEFTYVVPVAPITGDAYTAINPQRLADTRCSATPQPSYCAFEKLPSSNASLSAISAGKSIFVRAGGEDNIPADATAVVGNLTATGDSGGGYLIVYLGNTVPIRSDVNFTTGSTNTNMVISGINSSGQVNIENGGGAGTVDALFDVSGWFTSST